MRGREADGDVTLIERFGFLVFRVSCNRKGVVSFMLDSLFPHLHSNRTLVPLSRYPWHTVHEAATKYFSKTAPEELNWEARVEYVRPGDMHRRLMVRSV